MKKQKSTREIKKKARKNLSNRFEKNNQNYVIDTSAVINKFVSKLIKKGLRGRIIIPNAVIAELENLANKGTEAGFLGLEEIASFHKLKRQYKITVYFYGLRPNEMQIKFAKSGEIDSLIRDSAIKNKATLITADLVQAKSAQAYGMKVIFLKPKEVELKKKRFLFWKKK